MENRAINPKRVLITGAAGAIGSIVAAHLHARRHIVRGFDLLSALEGVDVEWVEGNLGDGDAVAHAMQGIDTVIHLGAYRHDADFMDVLLEPNVIGLYHVCHEAQKAGVQRLIVASSIQAINGHTEEKYPLPGDAIPAPTNHYGLTKVWAEQMGAMYARRYDMSAIGVRVGWFPRDAAMAERMREGNRGARTYLSPDDARRFFTNCVESEKPESGTSAVLFATSLPAGEPWYDLNLAESIIGYRPRDRFPIGLPEPS